MPFPPGCEDEDYCDLTTIGRVSGSPRTIEIWFALAADTIYVLSGGGHDAHWVKNLTRDQRVEVNLGGSSRHGRARIISSSDEDVRARRLLLEKYRPRAPRYRNRWGGDIERWGAASVAVAVDFDAGEQQVGAGGGQPLLHFDRVADDTDAGAIDAQLARRRAALAAAWQRDDAVVLVVAGEPLAVPGRGDLTYPFLAHSEYFYLTDRNRPGGVLAYDPAEGWSDFVAPVTSAERLWSGASDDYASGLPLPELEQWLRARAARPLATLGSPAPATAWWPSPDGPGLDAELGEELRYALNDVRRVKDAVELGRMRAAAAATTAAFCAVVEVLVEGTSEREAQIELEAAAFRHGAEAMAYETIVASGPNSAVLHFPPTARRLRDGDLVLIDAGAAHRGYAADVTRTYPVGGRLGPEQLELHSVVRAAQLAAIELCAPGTEWREVHAAAARAIAEGLAAAGILRGGRDELVESGAVALFFPHGIGHLVGLGVRDAHGPLRERRDAPPPFPNLRIDLPLRAGMTVTVEPGVYFVPAILGDPELRRRHRDRVAWDRVDALAGFGGIRIEDDVLVTEDGCELLSAEVPLLG